MGRPRRQIYSRQVYEICMRTSSGLPFVCTAYMKTILEGILARVQRDSKVVLCHFLWMANHAHIMIVAQDSAQCVRFYGEIQKQLTEAVKRLLGIKSLNLWKKNTTSVIHYGDLRGVVERIAYLYANPARAHLVDSIERYPGVSSWEAFQEIPSMLSAASTKNCLWIRPPAIPKLPCLSATARQDRAFTNRLEEHTKVSHELTLHPNAWMGVFGVTDDEVKAVNDEIRVLMQDMQADAREKRSLDRRKPLGERKLAEQRLTLNYLPKKDSRRIFIYAADAGLRIAMVRAYRHFCETCRECYQRWKHGDYKVEWPPGAFLPAMPPRSNCFYIA